MNWGPTSTAPAQKQQQQNRSRASCAKRADLRTCILLEQRNQLRNQGSRPTLERVALLGERVTLLLTPKSPVSLSCACSGSVTGAALNSMYITGKLCIASNVNIALTVGTNLCHLELVRPAKIARKIQEYLFNKLHDIFCRWRVRKYTRCPKLSHTFLA